MTNDDLEKGIKIKEEMAIMQDYITRLKLATNNSFEERNARFNLWGETSDYAGYVIIPRKIFRKVCKISLHECIRLLAVLEDEFKKI